MKDLSRMTDDRRREPEGNPTGGRLKLSERPAVTLSFSDRWGDGDEIKSILDDSIRAVALRGKLTCFRPASACFPPISDGNCCAQASFGFCADPGDHVACDWCINAEKLSQSLLHFPYQKAAGWMRRGPVFRRMWLTACFVAALRMHDPDGGIGQPSFAENILCVGRDDPQRFVDDVQW